MLPVLVFNDVAGVHEYVVAPLAVIDVELPMQILFDVAAAVITGNGFTVTLTVAVLLQPLCVPATV